MFMVESLCFTRFIIRNRVEERDPALKCRIYLAAEELDSILLNTKRGDGIQRFGHSIGLARTPNGS